MELMIETQGLNKMLPLPEAILSKVNAKTKATNPGKHSALRLLLN